MKSMMKNDISYIWRVISGGLDIYAKSGTAETGSEHLSVVWDL